MYIAAQSWASHASIQRVSSSSTSALRSVLSAGDAPTGTTVGGAGFGATAGGGGAGGTICGSAVERAARAAVDSEAVLAWGKGADTVGGSPSEPPQAVRATTVSIASRVALNMEPSLFLFKRSYFGIVGSGIIVPLSLTNQSRVASHPDGPFNVTLFLFG